MAMRALAHREEIIAGRKSVGRTFTDFARERLLRGADVEGVDFVPSIRAD